MASYDDAKKLRDEAARKALGEPTTFGGGEAIGEPVGTTWEEPDTVEEPAVEAPKPQRLGLGARLESIGERWPSQGNEFEDTDFLSRMTSGASGEPSPIQKPTIEEMIRTAPTLEDTIRDGPSARSLTLPTLLSPERTHAAKKQFLEDVTPIGSVKLLKEGIEERDILKGAAGGFMTGLDAAGLGMVGKAALPFIPLKPDFVKSLLHALSYKKHGKEAYEKRFGWSHHSPEEDFAFDLNHHVRRGLIEHQQTLPRVNPPGSALDPDFPTNYEEARDAYRLAKEARKNMAHDVPRISEAPEQVALELARKRYKKAKELKMAYADKTGARPNVRPLESSGSEEEWARRTREPFSRPIIEPLEEDILAAGRLNYPGSTLTARDRVQLTSRLERTPGWRQDPKDGMWSYDENPWEWADNPSTVKPWEREGFQAALNTRYRPDAGAQNIQGLHGRFASARYRASPLHREILDEEAIEIDPVWYWTEDLPVTSETWITLPSEGREALINRIFPADGTPLQRQRRLDHGVDSADPRNIPSVGTPADLPPRQETGAPGVLSNIYHPAPWEYPSKEVIRSSPKLMDRTGIKTTAKSSLHPRPTALLGLPDSIVGGTRLRQDNPLYALSDLDRKDLARFNAKNIYATSEETLTGFEEALKHLGYDGQDLNRLYAALASGHANEKTLVGLTEKLNDLGRKRVGRR